MVTNNFNPVLIGPTSSPNITVCQIGGQQGGQMQGTVPVYNSIKEALGSTAVDCSIIYVPPRFASDAIKEAADKAEEIGRAISKGSHRREGPDGQGQLTATMIRKLSHV